MGTGGVDIASPHQLHELICQFLVVGTKGKRNVIASAQPVATSVQIEEAGFTSFESAESRSDDRAVRFFLLAFNQTEREII